MENFIRIATISPRVHLASPAENAENAIRLFKAAADDGADVVVFPELSLTGATCGSLFASPALLNGAEAALESFAASTSAHPGAIGVVGLPFRWRNRVFVCAAVVGGGKVLGLVPAALPPVVAGLSADIFTSASVCPPGDLTARPFRPAEIPFGADLLFAIKGAIISIEPGETAFSPASRFPASALAGAAILLNPSCSPALAGSSQRESALAVSISRLCRAAFVRTAAGFGESTSDFAFAPGGIIAENGHLIASSGRFRHEAPFRRDDVVSFADIDCRFLAFERSRDPAFATCSPANMRIIQAAPHDATPIHREELLREINPDPFFLQYEKDGEARCREILEIQCAALARRIEATHAKGVVIGLSGGLDSALALLVCVETFKKLALPLSSIHAFTLPGFGTTKRTKGNAILLCEGFGIPVETVDMSPVVRLHFKDLDQSEDLHDTTYENAQARARTFFLMDKANQTGSLLIGTGDLSELALGWCTFNGDHMSMYCVNGGVPKTLIRHIVRYYAANHPETAKPLTDILDTPVSPELLPACGDGTILQKTESKLGPYELHDFFLYRFIRRGEDREQIAESAELAFAGKYPKEEIARCLDLFLARFATQQFKRNCMPEGPGTGSVGLSPRSGWAMPGDLAALPKAAP